MLRTEKQVAVLCPSSGGYWTVYILEKADDGCIKISHSIWSGKNYSSGKDIINTWLKGKI